MLLLWQRTQCFQNPTHELEKPDNTPLKLNFYDHPPQLNIDEQLACYRLLLEGKEGVQYWNYSSHEWIDWTIWACGIYPLSHPGVASPTLLRRKPAPAQPKCRPWKDAVEVPLGAWFRDKRNSPTGYCIALSINQRGVTMITADTGLFRYSFSELLQCTEHSIDHGKTWSVCGVKIEDPAVTGSLNSQRAVLIGAS